MEEESVLHPIRNRLSLEFNTARQEASTAKSLTDSTTSLPAFHTTSLTDLQHVFELEDSDYGLTSSQATALLAKHGKNEISPPKRNPLWMILGFVIGGFNGFLWFAAVLCFVSWRLGALVRPQKTTCVSFSILIPVAALPCCMGRILTHGTFLLCM